MPEYRRVYQPGGNFFLTLVTGRRKPHLATDEAVELLSASVQDVREVLPFETVAGVVLPDHVHVLWRLPRGDADYAKRVGMIKVGFTRRYRALSVAGRMAAMLNPRGSECLATAVLGAYG